jgi:hypothetical protein
MRRPRFLYGFAALAFALALLGINGATLDWKVATFAGDGTAGATNGAKDQARFNWPTDLVVTPDWQVFVADFGNHLIRRISSDGEVSTLAGSGQPGFADGVGHHAAFSGPNGLALGPDGHLYVADAGNARIRRVVLHGADVGTVTTVAGGPERGVRDGPGAAARFVYPTGIAFDLKGLLYVVDRWANMVRVITPDGQVGHLAGDGKPGRRDGPGPIARFDNPLSAVWLPRLGLVVTDSGNHAVRRIAANGVVTTLVGGPLPGNMDGPRDVAAFAWPIGVEGDGHGGIYVADAKNYRIRHIDSDLVVSTVAGRGFEGLADGAGPDAGFGFITGLGRDMAGNLLVADSAAHRIRWVLKGDRRVVGLGGGLALADTDR